MKIIEQYFEVDDSQFEGVYERIERAARTCYKSEGAIKPGSARELVKKLIKNNHTAMLEFAHITVRIITDRGVTHELVRHRIASYAQESTRYCNYSQDKFGNELTFIKPVFWSETHPRYFDWKKSMWDCERTYLRMVELGASPQEARSVLPNSLKTEIMVCMNVREWEHFFKLRAAEAAHPQMRDIATKIQNHFRSKLKDGEVCPQ